MKTILISILFLFSFGIADASNEILYASIDEGIGSFTAEYIATIVQEAEEGEYEAVVITLNTPGGLLDATRDIVSTFLESEVPIVVYVAPGGARAGSAGVFITLSANIAAMAPGTNIGAAHPVGMGGESGDSSDVMTQKVTNDAAALIRSIAKKRKKNQDYAELTVRESLSYSETEALDSNLIDLIAKNRNALIKAIHGMQVETTKGLKTLNTKSAKIVVRDKDWKESLLSFISDPNIAYIFILLTMYGIMIELYNPGAIFPGVIGVMSAILAGFSLQMLPVNYAGLALMIVAIVLFILEVKIVSYGMLSLGGIVSFLLGSIMLIDSPGDFMQIGIEIIIVATLVTAALFISIITLALKSQRKNVASGVNTLVGKEAIVFTAITPETMGKVKVTGELWRAKSSKSFQKNDKVIVKSVDGLTLEVE
ncbi:MAG: nodulation protein NfeD [Candidatus Kapaibacterium sp.]|nr:nodulation protein NfeD [Ignavibacteriota bacterium]MCB9221224.1 nodulation protein NfeD [Ignavibacteria bacterium]